MTTSSTKPGTQRLSVVIPEDDHQIIKTGASSRRHSITEEVLELFRARNGVADWPEDVVDSVRRQIARTAQ